MLRGRFPTVALVVLGGCVATPLPDPPDLDHPELELVTADPVSGLLDPAVAVTGRPGAAQPGATLRIYPLDRSVPPVETTVAANGSFETSVTAAPGEELRLSLFTAERRAPPLDVIVPRTSGMLEPAPRDPCLRVEPELDVQAAVGESAARPIVVFNECLGAVTVTAAPRTTFPGLSLDPSGASTIAAGARGEVVVSYVASAPVTTEEIVLLTIDGAVVERRAVTVRARTR